MTVRHGSRKTPRKTKIKTYPGVPYGMTPEQYSASFKKPEPTVAQLVAAEEDRQERLSRMGIPERPRIITDVECLQEMGCPCPKCKADNKRRAEEQARQGRLLDAFKREFEDIDAGQGHSNAVTEEEGLLRWNAFDQPILPITTRGKLLSKMDAEDDDHQDSIDWAASPAGCKDTYRFLVSMALEGFDRHGATIAQVNAAKLIMPEVHLAWLEHGNNAALIVRSLDGLITLMADPASAPKDPYPGAPEGHYLRLAGRTHNGGLAHIVSIMMTVPRLARASDRERAYLLNCQETRDALHLHEYRYVSVSAMADARRSARKQGLIERVQEAVHYRDQHRWRVAEPNIWKTLVEVPPLLTAQFKALAEAVFTAKAEEIKQRLRDDDYELEMAA